MKNKSTGSNPSISTFNSNTSITHKYFLTNESIAKFITNPKSFKKMLASILEEMKYDLEDRDAYEPFPLMTPEMAAAWSVQSPCGQEHVNPPIAWQFDERMQLALNNPECTLVTFNTKLEKKVFTTLLEKVLGEGSVIPKLTQKMETPTEFSQYLDDMFDNWGSGGDCTC